MHFITMDSLMANQPTRKSSFNSSPVRMCTLVYQFYWGPLLIQFLFVVRKYWNWNEIESDQSNSTFYIWMGSNFHSSLLTSTCANNRMKNQFFSRKKTFAVFRSSSQWLCALRHICAAQNSWKVSRLQKCYDCAIHKNTKTVYTCLNNFCVDEAKTLSKLTWITILSSVLNFRVEIKQCTIYAIAENEKNEIMNCQTTNSHTHKPKYSLKFIWNP